MRVFFAISVGLLTALMVSAQSITPTKPLGFRPSQIDRSADPCSNFYQYACGNWMKQNPIPADEGRYGSFDALQERNYFLLRGILEESAKEDPKRTPIEQKIGDFYRSCMDEQTINQKETAPLKPVLDRIAALSGKSELASIVASLHNSGVPALFTFTSGADFKDSSMNLGQLFQGGLGLPDRDYYFRDDPQSMEIRKQYVEHMQKMFHLLGLSEEDSAAKAKTVMEFETAMAKASLDRVSRRDPDKTYHKMTMNELESLSPSFAWSRFFQGVKAPAFQNLNVEVPDFTKEISALAESQSLDSWKTYLTWHVLDQMAALLPEAFVQEDFNFNGKILTGAKQIKPRWRRCVEMTDSQLGEALGQKYVEKTFSPESKRKMLMMVHELEKSLGEDVRSLEWMTPTTKNRAIEKLQAIENKIGYPDKWRDYSSVKVVRGEALGNLMRSSDFEQNYQLSKIGKPVDKKEWGMTPPTVNAYYNPTMNNINFPAGILQPPFYDSKMDDALNFGGIGSVIGHELTHGFDDEGRRFDAKGNLEDWWTDEDGRKFEERAQCLVDQYEGFTPVPGVHLNGKLTLGENTADNGGLRIALMALLDVIGNKKQPKIDGFTPEQRLFLGWATVWCQNTREEEARRRAALDPHSPGEFRVNGVVSNMPEFREAFSCKPGQPMAPEKSCRVW